MPHLVVLIVIMSVFLSSCAKKDPSQDYAIQNAVENDDDPDPPLP